MSYRPARSLWGCVAVLVLALVSSTGAHTESVSREDDLSRALNRLYNFDFAGTHAILDQHLQSDPDDPLAHALHGAAYLFSEFDRLKVLEADFFADDDKVTDGKRLKPDPAARQLIFAATAQARASAVARLSTHKDDRDGLFALCMAAGVENEYTILVEKKYLRSYQLSRETQGYARTLLALNPPFYDAYLTMGSVEYVVSNLNFFFRLFVHFEGIEGSRQRAIDDLKTVAARGRFYPPFAKILLSVIYLREKKPGEALSLLKELEREFPENPLFHREVASVAMKAGSQ
jgi:hypothetical protein